MTNTQLRAEVMRCLHYNPGTGRFVWKVSNSNRAPVGSTAGTLSRGYIQIQVHGRIYRAHRLAFLIMTGELPVDVDHRNERKADNRWKNLRHADHSTNGMNQRNPRADNKVGVRGVTFDRARGKFVAELRVRGRRPLRKRFDTLEAAIVARRTAEVAHFGEFAPWAS